MPKAAVRFARRNSEQPPVRFQVVEKLQDSVEQWLLDHPVLAGGVEAALVGLGKLEMVRIGDERRAVVIEWRSGPELAFQGERQDLLEIVGNVMENACKWSAGKVRVTAEGAEAQLRLTVEDDGAGLPPERRAEVLQRGARLDEKTPGSGLGLSIVDELARAYGGSIRLDGSSLGGLMVEILLPRAES